LSFSLLFSPNLGFRVDTIACGGAPGAALTTQTETPSTSNNYTSGYDDDVIIESVPCGQKEDFSKIKVMHRGAINKTYNFTTKIWDDSHLGGEVYNKSTVWREGVCDEVTAQNVIDYCELLYDQRKKSADKKIYVAAGTFKFSTDSYSTQDVNNILNNNKDTYFFKSFGFKGEKYSFIDRGDGSKYKYKPYYLIYAYSMFTYCSTTACEGWKFFDTKTGEVLEYETNQDKVWSFYPSTL
jgi:hypothetical protein